MEAHQTSNAGTYLEVKKLSRVRWWHVWIQVGAIITVYILHYYLPLLVNKDSHKYVDVRDVILKEHKLSP